MTTTNPLGLRPFQLAAADHLDRLPGRLIADDPGTGKTYMAGELDRRCRERDLDIRCGAWKPTLVICPKAMLYTWGGWYAELRPNERLAVLDPRSADTREPFKKAVLNQSADIYVVHYEGLKILLEYLHPIQWFHIIADEAHKISNYRSQNSKAVRALKATWRTALTGTPADRAPDQLWAVLNFLDKRTWSSYWNYRKRYVTEYVDIDNKPVTGANPHTMPELHQRLKPVMVRRRKQEVLPELPTKSYQNVWVDLSAKQRKVYDQMRENMLAWVGEHEDEPLQAAVVIAQLIRLQQIALATPRFETKMVKKKLLCWLPAGHTEPCMGLDTYQIPDDWDGVEDPEAPVHWHGQYYDAEVTEIILEDPSSKLDAAMELIQARVDAGEQVVVFSQFSRAIDLLCARLDKAGITNGKYTGGTRNTTRNNIVTGFAAGTISVFAGTIGAGGTGLNLQTAGTAIFLDRAWKPGDNLQAEDRVHRMGQEADNVTIIDIMARGTIDRGRHQHIRRNWHEVQKLLGDKDFDWTHSLVEEEPIF